MQGKTAQGSLFRRPGSLTHAAIDCLETLNSSCPRTSSANQQPKDTLTLLLRLLCCVESTTTEHLLEHSTHRCLFSLASMHQNGFKLFSHSCSYQLAHHYTSPSAVPEALTRCHQSVESNVLMHTSWRPTCTAPQTAEHCL